MIEEWKPIIGYAGLYEISSLGKVKSLNYNRTGKQNTLTPWKLKYGHSQIHLYGNGDKKRVSIHRLVAEHFIPNPDNLPCVCHKKEDLDERGLLYNGKDNLFWGTVKDNIQDCHKKGRTNNYFTNKKPMKGKFGKDHQSSKKVYQYSLSGKFIKEWYSISDVRRELKINNVCHCIKGRLKSAGGFIWVDRKIYEIEYYK